MTAPVAYRLERLPGGPCTHWKVPPYHGTHPERKYTVPERYYEGLFVICPLELKREFENSI